MMNNPRNSSSLRFLKCCALLLLTPFSTAALCAQSPADLQQEITAIAAAHHGKVALFAENLKTGQTIGIQPDEVVQTASVIKLTALYEAMEQIRKGKIHLDDRIVLKKSDQVPGSGILLFFDTPLTITLKDALTMMIIMSDNTATNLVIDHVGLASINTRIQTLGLKNTYFYKKVFQQAEGPMPDDQKVYGLGKTTPREMAEVMRKIAACDLAQPGLPSTPQDGELCGVMLHMLTNQFYQDGVPRYIEALNSGPGENAIANKTGALDAVRNDIAAVSSRNGLLILSMFTYENRDHSWTVDNEGEITIAKFARAIVNAWSPGGLVSFPQTEKK